MPVGTLIERARHAGHSIKVGKFPRGMTTIAPRRQLWGSYATCTCGWSRRVNVTKGAKGGANQLANDHARQVLA